jgi:hypothetical protein
MAPRFQSSRCRHSGCGCYQEKGVKSEFQLKSASTPSFEDEDDDEDENERLPHSGLVENAS